MTKNRPGILVWRAAGNPASTLPSECIDRYAELASQMSAARAVIPPRLNLLLTNRCQSGCRYCFARAMMSGSEMEMSERGFRDCLEFLKKSGMREVRLLGGEPMLHSRIRHFLELALSDRFFEEVRVFTGGIFPESLVPLLADARVSVLANLNSMADYRPALADRAYGNIRKLIARGGKVSLSFNIYKHDFDWRWLAGLCRGLGVSGVRVAFANPGNGAGNTAMDRRARSRLAGALVELAGACSEGGVKVNFDCGITPCMFSDAQAGALVKMFPDSLKNLKPCHPPLDVMPDLTVMRCFGVGSGSAVPLNGFSCAGQLQWHFAAELDAWRGFIADDECRVCSYFRSGACLGGCLGGRVGKLSLIRASAKDAAPLFEKARALCGRGDVSGALRGFKEGIALFPEPEAVADYAVLLADSGRLREAERVLELYKPQLRNSHAGWLARGYLHELGGRRFPAAGCYRRALPGLGKSWQKKLAARIERLLGNAAGFRKLVGGAGRN